MTELEKIVQKRGSLQAVYSPGGSGMGLFWTVNAGGWPYASAGSFEDAVRLLVIRHLELEEAEIKARRVAVEVSSGL